MHLLSYIVLGLVGNVCAIAAGIPNVAARDVQQHDVPSNTESELSPGEVF